MIEYFDIVDENDMVIGKAPRSECHANPKLIHRGIFVVILNEKNEMLLEKRSMNKDTNPGKWAVIGEHNKLGESYKDAAIRGLKEELGIKTTVRKISKIKLITKRETEFDEIFVTKIKSNSKIKIDKKEISKVKFVSFSDLKKEIKEKPKSFSYWSIVVIKKFLQHYKL